MTETLRVLTVFGTRPELIKLAPVIALLRETPSVDVKVCKTGQHREMLGQMLSFFRIEPDFDLDVMRPDQGLAQITGDILCGVKGLIDDYRPHRVLVQGDTTTTLSASLAALYAQTPVAHIEAGLRTGDLYSPWPEEANRRLTTVLADLHCAPTETARLNLLREGVADENIVVTGNTAVDALTQVVDQLRRDPAMSAELADSYSYLDPGKKLIVVTAHRRESFGGRFNRICQALKTIAKRSDVQIVFPVHLNPNVRKPTLRHLSDLRNVFLIEPQDYLHFVFLMTRAYLIISDSGGIQEEAPSISKPVLLLRENTERPEALNAGAVKLVGTEPSSIVSAATLLLDEPVAYRAMTDLPNPYGDGHASKRIVTAILERTPRSHRLSSPSRDSQVETRTGATRG